MLLLQCVSLDRLSSGDFALHLPNAASHWDLGKSERERSWLLCLVDWAMWELCFGRVREGAGWWLRKVSLVNQACSAPSRNYQMLFMLSQIISLSLPSTLKPPPPCIHIFFLVCSKPFHVHTELTSMVVANARSERREQDRRKELTRKGFGATAYTSPEKTG